MQLSEFSRRSATLKFANGFLGEILPPRDVDGLQPTFFPPAPSGDWGNANLFKPFVEADNSSGRETGRETIHTHTFAARLVSRFVLV